MCLVSYGTLIMLFFTINYNCSPLILNDFMCGLNIVICIGEIRDREGRRREGGGGSSTFDLFTYNLPPYEHSKLETQLLGAGKKKQNLTVLRKNVVIIKGFFFSFFYHFILKGFVMSHSPLW